jgi:hypothetical protein
MAVWFGHEKSFTPRRIDVMKLQQQHKNMVTRSRAPGEFLLAAMAPVRPNAAHPTNTPWTCPRTTDYSVMSLFHDRFPKDGVSEGEAEGSRLGMAFNIHTGGLSRQGRFTWGGPNSLTPVNKDFLLAATARGEHFHMSLGNTSALKTAILMDGEIGDAVRKKRTLDSAPKLPVVLLGFERADGEKKAELSEIGGPTLLPDLPVTDLADFKQLGNYATQLLNRHSLYDVGWSDEAEGGIRIRLSTHTCDHDVPQALDHMAPGFSVVQEEFVLPPGFDLAQCKGADIAFDVGTVLEAGQLIGYASAFPSAAEVKAPTSGTIVDIDASNEANVVVRQGQYADWQQVVTAGELTASEVDFVLGAAWARAWQGGKEFGLKKGSEYWPETIRWIDIRLVNSELLKPSTAIGDELMSVMSMDKDRKEFRLLTDFTELLNPGGRMPIQVFSMMQANPTSLLFKDSSGKTSLDLHSVPPSRLPYRNVAVARVRGEQANRTVSENLQNAAKKNPAGLFGGLTSTPTASS